MRVGLQFVAGGGGEVVVVGTGHVVGDDVGLLLEEGRRRSDFV